MAKKGVFWIIFEALSYQKSWEKYPAPISFHLLIFLSIPHFQASHFVFSHLCISFSPSLPLFLPPSFSLSLPLTSSIYLLSLKKGKGYTEM